MSNDIICLIPPSICLILILFACCCGYQIDKQEKKERKIASENVKLYFIAVEKLLKNYEGYLNKYLDK